MPNYVQYSTSNLTGSLRKGNVALGVTTASIAGPTSTTNWYTGITPTAGKYVIYKTAASGDPDIFCPQTNTELYNFVIMQGGSSANTTSVSASLDWIATQTGLLATNFEYENIVTSGSVFHMDAGFVGSYPTTSSIWYDLSGNNRNSLLFNSPTFSESNSGSLTFSTASLNYATASNIGTLQNWTVEVWIKFNSTTTNHVSMILGNQFNGSTSINFAIGTNNAGVVAGAAQWNIVVGFFQNAWYNTTGFAPVIDTWYQVVGRYNGGQLQQFVNGTLTDTVNVIQTLASGGEIRMMRRWDNTVTAGNLFNGNLAIARIYNRALLTSEILQNYNAQKGRFGL